MNNQEFLAEIMMVPATELALLQRIAGVHHVALDPDGDAMKNALVAHLQTLTPTDPADPAAEAELLAWMAAPTPAPGAPAPAPAPAPALSTVYTNEHVLIAASDATPAQTTGLRTILAAYGLPTTGSFSDLQDRAVNHISALDLDDYAPAAVDDQMDEWQPQGWRERIRNLTWRQVAIPVGIAAGVLLGLWAITAIFGGDNGVEKANGQEPEATATATPTTAPTVTPTPTTEPDDISEDREELIADVESERTKTDDEHRADFDELIANAEKAKTADELEKLQADFDELVARIKDEKDDDDDAEKPEPIDTAVTDKPEPSYKPPHRQPEKDFNVKCDKTFMDDTRWLLCEPGALQTEVGSFRWPEAEGVTYRSNCPEGFMWYGSMGQGKITTETSTLVMQPENGLNYLVVIRCPLNDAIVDSDRNLTLRISDIVVGHAGWTPVDVLGGIRNPEDAAYVSMEWFGEQLVVSGTKSGTNCGATGCSRTIVVLHDVDSGLHERYLVTDVKGEVGDTDNDGIEDYASATWKKIYTNAR